MFRKSGLGPTISLLIGLLLVASACGTGGEDDQSQALESAEVTTTVEQETTTTSTAPPVEETTAEDTTVEDSADQEPVADDGPSRAALEEFCDASADYFVASQSAQHIDSGRPGELSMFYSVIDTRLDEAVAVAPNDEMAEPALLARTHFTILHAAMDDAGYDPEVVESRDDFSDLEVSLQTMIDIDDMLSSFLTESCGYDADALDESARMVADDIGRLVDDVLSDSGADDDAIDGDYPGDYIEIGDSTDRLKVEVPLDWEDTQSEPLGSGSSIVIAPDVSQYLTSWRADGLKMTVKDASRPVDWRAPMYETLASEECTLVSSDPYSDALYTGWIDRYDNCGGGPASAVVIGATDEDFSIEILVEVQFDDVDTQNDDATLTQILDTFKAR